MKIATFALAGLIAAWGLGGCRGEEAKPAPASPPPPSEGIEVVSPGATPWVPLRYHLERGAPTRVEMAIDLDLAMGGRGGAMPTFVVAMEITADEIQPDGSARIRTVLAEATARDRAGSAIPTETMRAQAAMLEGVSLTATLSPDGRISGTQVAPGTQMTPALQGQLAQLTQNLEQVAMPLPTAPVGVGAVWKHRRTVRQNGVAMETVTTVEVTAVEGDRVSFRSTSTVRGADQKVTIEGTPLEITKIGGDGTGHGTIDLAKMALTGELAAEFHFEMAAQGQVSPMKMTMAMRLAPYERAAAPR